MFTKRAAFILSGCIRRRRHHISFLFKLYLVCSVCCIPLILVRRALLNSSPPTNEIHYNSSLPPPTLQQEEWKTILFWTRDHEDSRTYAVGLGKNGFRQAGCPVWQCEVFDAEIEDSPVQDEEHDAVVFFEPSWTNRIVPEKRSPHQFYVFWTLESPGWRRPSKPQMLKNFFNWTMTYHSDSDVVQSYGWTSKLAQPSGRTKSSVNYAKGKTKMAVWSVSNCLATSGRNEFVQNLQKFIHVDVYGRCGNFSCPRSTEEYCRRMMERTYKFYLAFENSICEDYVTEKYFVTMQYNIIPVVLDAHGNYKRQYAPPHSYINALDFPSVRHLADYLILLDQNDTLYNQYFDWKGHYDVHFDSTFQRGLCNLCAALHNKPVPQPKVYEDLVEWWETRSRCKTVRFDQIRQQSDREMYPIVVSDLY